MPQTINTNLSSLTAQRNANRTQNDLGTAIQRLSSGLRINSAKDDAAGLAIAERFTTQIRGLNQATRNANDGISLAQVAEGALGSISNNLQRIRELAVQSANATNSASDRAALQQEVSQLVGEIGRVGNTTNFNGLKILDGTYATQQFQVGANAGDTISVSIADARSQSLGANTVSSGSGVVTAGNAGGVAVYTGNVVINGTTINTATATGASDVVASINAQSSITGVNAARAITNVNSIAYTATANATVIQINGVGIALGISTSGVNAAAAINNASAQTGVTASFAGGKLTLTSAGGADVTVADDATNSVLGAVNGTAATLGAGKNVTLSAGITLSTRVGGALAVAEGGTTTAKDLEIGGAATSAPIAATYQVSTLDISSVTGANNTLFAVDAALQQVNGQRSQLGAIQNRFSSTIENLQTSSENQSAARSRIQDADFAQETANLSRAQVLQQAGTAMIAQANQLPQQVLALLKG